MRKRNPLVLLLPVALIFGLSWNGCLVEDDDDGEVDTTIIREQPVVEDDDADIDVNIDDDDLDLPEPPDIDIDVEVPPEEDEPPPGKAKGPPPTA